MKMMITKTMKTTLASILLPLLWLSWSNTATASPSLSGDEPPPLTQQLRHHHHQHRQLFPAGFVKPDTRYKPYADLSAAARSAAGTLGYSGTSWNNPGTAAIENQKYHELLTLNEVAAATAIDCGTEECWDCFQHRYLEYDWSELPESAKDGLRKLGWNENTYNNDIAPASDTKDWADLTPAEKQGADLLCFFEETWDEDPIPTWGEDDGGNNGGNTGGGICFSGRTVVEVQGHGMVRMDALKIGDSVLTADGTYSKVYSFGHFAPKDVTPYLQIRTDAGPAGQPSLEITKGHMLYVLHHHSTSNKALPVPAGDVKVGDVLVSVPGQPHQVVTSIRSVSRRGAYAPFTVTGDLVVSGVVASNYIALPEVFQAHVSHKQQHWMQHAALQPIRAFCGVLGCENETYDEATGYSKPVSLWMLILHWAHKIHSPVCMSGFLYLFALPTLWLVLNMTHLVAAMLGYYVWKKTVKKESSDKVGAMAQKIPSES